MTMSIVPDAIRRENSSVHYRRMSSDKQFYLLTFNPSHLA